MILPLNHFFQKQDLMCESWKAKDKRLRQKQQKYKKKKCENIDEKKKKKHVNNTESINKNGKKERVWVYKFVR